MLTSLAITLALALLLTVAVRAVAQRWQIFDEPDGQRKVHRRRVALWGGVAVYAALLLGLLYACHAPETASKALSDLARVLLPTAGLVCLIGAWDDWRELPAKLKLLLQLVSVLPIIAAGYAVDRIVVFGYPISLGWLGVPVTILWLLGCINALNLIDGMDGLASIVGLSTTAMMALIALSAGNGHIAVIAVILAAALSGFLVFNLPPATIFLGDSGSTLIGLVVGILGMQGSMKSSATLAITAPVVLMTLPMFDVVMAVVRRKLTGRPFDAADREHIHHRLLDRGLSTWQVLWILGALCLTTGAAATAATVFRLDALAWIIASTMVVAMIRLRLFGDYELGLMRSALRRGIVSFAKRLLSLPWPKVRPADDVWPPGQIHALPQIS
ncbi:MAG: MraY family glycosyltransferase, partial [Thermoguttaceae bacterium]